jgi:hypothetical protein
MRMSWKDFREMRVFKMALGFARATRHASLRLSLEKCEHDAVIRFESKFDG